MALPHRSLTLLGLGITLMCLSNLTLSKEFYKWEDAAGVTHYSSQPSKDYKSVKIRASNIKDSDTPPAAPVSDTTQSENPAADNPTTDRTAQHTKDPERCATAQQNRKTLTDNARIRMKDGEEFRYLTPAEIQQQKDTADQIIAEEC